MSLAQHPSPQALRVVLEPDQTSPLTAGAVPLVLLAYAPAEVQDAALAELAPPGEAAEVRRQLPPIVGAALARDEDQTFQGATVLAVPVLRDDGIVAALGVAAPTERATRRWQARARGALRRSAVAVETELRSGHAG
jgi:DNA-binding IclR family transcriptional regulator